MTIGGGTVVGYLAEAAFRAGQKAYRNNPAMPLSLIGCDPHIEGFWTIGADPFNFVRGWKAEQEAAKCST